MVAVSDPSLQEKVSTLDDCLKKGQPNFYLEKIKLFSIKI